jgi:hypothetical protein
MFKVSMSDGAEKLIWEKNSFQSSAVVRNQHGIFFEEDIRIL